MLAAVVVGAGELVVAEKPDAPLAPGEVLVRPRYVGLCGSDLSYFRKGANGAFVIREPLTLGHEITAEIVAISPEAAAGAGARYAVGQAVVVHPVWPCPPEGETEIPAHLHEVPGGFLGSASTWPHTHGALRELVSVRPERLRSLPAGLPLTRAALAEPLSVVLHAVDRIPSAIAGARVLVCGAGPIGLLAVVALLRRGAESVAVTDLHAHPLAAAAKVGASAGYRVGDAENPVPADSFDLVVEATGVPASLNTALAAAAPGGTILQLGMLSRDGVTSDLGALVVKELTLVGTHRFLAELDPAIALLAEAPECDAIVTDIVPLAESERALALAGDSTASSKVLVEVTAAG